MGKELKWYWFRFRVLALVVVMLMSVGYLGYRFHLVTRVLPMGDGPAGPAVSRELFDTTWSERKVVLVGIGDSITCGLVLRPSAIIFPCLL